MKDLKRQYLEFLWGDLRNTYIEDDHLRIYIRKGRHMIGRDFLHTLDIANVANTEFDDCDDEIGTNITLRHKGHFRDFMRFVEEHNPYGIIYVECVISRRMEEIIAKNGYTTASYQNCYYKKVGTYKIGSTDAVEQHG